MLADYETLSRRCFRGTRHLDLRWLGTHKDCRLGTSVLQRRLVKRRFAVVDPALNPIVQ